MVNIAEEIKHPEKTLPNAIFLALGLASLLYVAVAIAMILVLPLSTLSESNAPLAAFMTQKGHSPALITLISLIAIINGAFAQIIMASRVIYGMAKKHQAPVLFAKLNAKTQTPVISTVFVVSIIFILTLWFNIEFLAKMTSTVILGVFTVIHLALIVIKCKGISPGAGKNYSIVFPISGFFVSIAFLCSQLFF